MKLNKYLTTLFISSCLLSNICLSMNENDHMEKIVHEEKESLDKKIDTLERPTHQENEDRILLKPNNSDLPQESLNVEKPQNQVVIEKQKKLPKKIQKKKTDDVNPSEQSAPESDTESNNQESKPKGVDLSKTDSSSVEFQEFRSKSSRQPERDSKEYMIRGLVSMLLVIAGAILLVVVIITGVNNKKKKR